MIHNPLFLNIRLSGEVSAALLAAKDTFYVEEGSTYDGQTFEQLLESSYDLKEVWHALTKEGDDGMEGADPFEMLEAMQDALVLCSTPVIEQ